MIYSFLKCSVTREKVVFKTKKCILEKISKFLLCLEEIMMKSPNIDGILQVRFLNYINNKIDFLNGRKQS